MKQSVNRFRVQLLANSLSGGCIGSNLKLLRESFGKGKALRAKRLLLQCPAEVAPDGRLIHCEQCPDATVRGGKLVPVCISDLVNID